MRTSYEFVQGSGIAARVAELCIGEVADICSVYLRNRGPEPVAFASRDPKRFAPLRDALRDDAFADRARACGIDFLLEEPLFAGERVVGTLVIGVMGAKRMSPSRRRAVTLLAAILSVAIDHAEQLSVHYHVSKRLQAAMLPARLASADGVLFDAAYLPASGESDVGGDWYDTFDLGGGVIGISVGDVVGHGLEAAVAMSEIRGAIRATAVTTNSPSVLLQRVDELMSAQSIGMATAIAAFYESTTGVLRYACGGHPPPALLTASGKAMFLPGGGLMLGLGAGTMSEDITVTLPPGATLFLYTDGLLEYGRDVLAGEQLLLDALRSIDPNEHRYADALHARLFEGGVENADDCATLAIHRRCSDGDVERMRYSSIPACAALAREAFRNFSGRFVDSDERRYELVSAVGEAVANAIEHGTHEPGNIFEMEANRQGHSIVVEVRNPGHWRSFKPSIDRGRGLHIMRTYSDSMEIASAQDQTSVKLVFRAGSGALRNDARA